MSQLELTRVSPGLWEAFHARKLEGLPSHPVLDRWRRVERLGVEPRGSHEGLELLRGPGLEERQERSAPMLGAAGEVLEASLAVFSRAHYSLLLCDAEGLILRSEGGGEFAATARQLHLIEGGRWAEEVQGTNAIGTALVEGRPVTVDGCAHFVRPNHSLVCYASPIRDPYGQVVGVVDATSRVEAAHPAIQLAVVNAAHAIQAALRGQAWASGGDLGIGPLLRRSASPAVLVEWPGVVKAANDAAATDPAGLLPGARLDAACGLSWNDLLAQLDQGRARIEVERWGVGGGPRMLSLHPVEGPGSLTLAVVVRIEPRTVTTAAARRQAAGVTASAAAGPFASLLGSDPVMEGTKQLAARIAGSSLPVLLLAETGTGKGLLAQGIHDAGQRASGPLMDINCGALSPQLLESELFGYAPGAFTGAQRGGRHGKIHDAAGGTLFLDEIGEMSAALQAMLLKVLEEGIYFRVGEDRPRQSDFRLISATCRDLETMVAEGTFRRDLYYRIRGATLTLPALRDRDDLLELCDGLLLRLAREQGGAGAVPLRLSAPAVRAIERHRWPGNIRELRMALQFAMAVAQGGVITVDDLPPEVREGAVAAPSAAGSGQTLTLRRSQRQTLLEVLRETAGNVSETARRLGVARSTVYRMLERHDLRVNRSADPRTR